MRIRNLMRLMGRTSLGIILGTVVSSDKPMPQKSFSGSDEVQNKRATPATQESYRVPNEIWQEVLGHPEFSGILQRMPEEITDFYKKASDEEKEHACGSLCGTSYITNPLTNRTHEFNNERGFIDNDDFFGFSGFWLFESIGVYRADFADHRKFYLKGCELFKELEPEQREAVVHLLKTEIQWRQRSIFAAKAENNK